MWHFENFKCFNFNFKCWQPPPVLPPSWGLNVSSYFTPSRMSLINVACVLVQIQSPAVLLFLQCTVKYDGCGSFLKDLGCILYDSTSCLSMVGIIKWLVLFKVEWYRTLTNTENDQIVQVNISTLRKHPRGTLCFRPLFGFWHVSTLWKTWLCNGTCAQTCITTNH